MSSKGILLANPLSTNLSHEKSSALLSIESWLFTRDPYKGFLKSPHNRVGFHPLNIPGKQPFGPFFHSSFGTLGLFFGDIC